MKTHPKRHLCVAALCLLLSSTTQLAAQTGARPSADLTLAGALAEALTASPALEKFSYARRAAEAEQLQAGLRPNPRVAVELENFAGSGAVSGARALETTLMLSQLLELGGKRERRNALALRNLELVEADYAVARLDVLAEVARRFIHGVRDQALLEVAQTGVRLAEDNRATVAARVDAARALAAELNRAEIELARARLALEHREHELDSSRFRLAAALGSEMVDFGNLHADLLVQPAARPLAEVLEQLRRSPDLARYLTRARIRSAELALARARSVPNAQIGAGLRRLERSNDQAFLISLSVDLPLFDRNQGAISAAEARLGEVDVDARMHHIEAQAVVYTTYQELQHARTETEILRDVVLPQSRTALQAYEAGFAKGRFSYLEVADMRREFIRTQAELIEASAAFHTYLIEIERLTGIAAGEQEATQP